jgi:hypothetical protein
MLNPYCIPIKKHNDFLLKLFDKAIIKIGRKNILKKFLDEYFVLCKWKDDLDADKILSMIQHDSGIYDYYYIMPTHDEIKNYIRDKHTKIH